MHQPLLDFLTLDAKRRISDLTQNGFSEQETTQLIEHGQELELPPTLALRPSV